MRVSSTIRLRCAEAWPLLLVVPLIAADVAYFAAKSQPVVLRSHNSLRVPPRTSDEIKAPVTLGTAA